MAQQGRRAPHTMQVDDEVWDLIVKEAAVNNPAPWLREALRQVAALHPRDRSGLVDGRLGAFLWRVRQQAGQPDRVPDAHRGCLFRVSRSTRHPLGTLCDTCGDVIMVGELAIIYDRSTKVDCVPCFEADRSPVKYLMQAAGLD